jgi:PAS domain S-box-containing protein
MNARPKKQSNVSSVSLLQEKETALRVSERRYRRLFEAAHDGILILDADTGQIVDVNPFLIDMLGYSREEFLDKKLWEIGIFDDIESSKNIFLELKAKGYVRYEDMPLETKDGHHRDVEFVSNVYLVDDERVIQCNIRDITRRKQTDMALKKLNESLEEKVLERTQALERKNEQLRALAVVLTRTEQRERRRLAQMLHDNLQQLIAGAKINLQGIIPAEIEPWLKERLVVIDELLNQALQASRKLTVELSPPILYESGLSAALKWLSGQMQKNYDLRVDYDCSLQESVAEDISVLMYSIARELLFNTVKHSGQLHVKLTLSKTDDGCVRMVIKDGGIGFNIEDIEADKINEKFGLFNIRNRVEMLKGRFYIDSSHRQGTTITSEVPAKWAAPAKSKHMKAKIDKGASHIAGAESSESRIQLLLVDDQEILRGGLKSLFLHELDMLVIGEAVDGIDGVEQAEKLRPDVILMDINMPNMDGIEATRQILARMPDMKIVGLSIHEDETIAQSMRNAGAVGYITKGASSEEICAAIRKAVI